MNKLEFDKHVRVMAFIDWLFRWVTPVFCALVLIGALAVILSRGGIR